MNAPHSPEAERGVISSMLQPGGLEPTINLMAERGLTAESFYLPYHGAIYAKIAQAWAERAPCDFITLTQLLRDSGQLGECGGPAYIADLFTYLPTAVLAGEYVEILLEKFKLRQLLTLCHKTAARCVEEQEDPWRVLNDTTEAITDLNRSTLRQKPKTFNLLLRDKLERFEQGQPDEDVLKTGFALLDEKSPVRRGDMPVIAGEAKAGKSMFALSIGTNMARCGVAVGYSSHEMPAAEQVDRLLHGAARVPTAHNHLHKLVEGELQRIQTTVHEIARLRVDIRDDLSDISSILAWARSLKTKWPDLGAVFVDYAQLVRGIRHKGDTREMEIAGISRALRQLAMELHCVVFVLSQLNKQGDTRESMAFEQDTTALWKITLDDKPNTRIITIPRQRNGESGIGFRVAFLGEIARVENLAQQPDDDQHQASHHSRSRPKRRWDQD